MSGHGNNPLGELWQYLQIGVAILLAIWMGWWFPVVILGVAFLTQVFLGKETFFGKKRREKKKKAGAAEAETVYQAAKAKVLSAVTGTEQEKAEAQIGLTEASQKKAAGGSDKIFDLYQRVIFGILAILLLGWIVFHFGLFGRVFDGNDEEKTGPGTAKKILQRIEKFAQGGVTAGDDTAALQQELEAAKAGGATSSTGGWAPYFEGKTPYESTDGFKGLRWNLVTGDTVIVTYPVWTGNGQETRMVSMEFSNPLGEREIKCPDPYHPGDPRWKRALGPVTITSLHSGREATIEIQKYVK